ncbi:efflux RND transporter permease subunit [Neomoorella thermoacetica]|uniref:efflux RND transporter permease subunit n=1 Tax=Neomoorella thermoacetica TaxID=1525 RepID=UPI0008FAEA50|nr:efflux RND transporter permease subunit [Moorella thermoacetica]APC09565.1 swarming motility protein SwrC [Moorella thermoacetica]
MNWSQAVIKRPVALTMVVLVVILMGVVSLSRLKVDLLPDMKLPYAAVITSYSGAGPEEIEKTVTRPLEDALGTVQGIKNIRSMSMSGSSVIILEFNWGQDMDFATLNMREKIDQIQSRLPDGVDKPMVMKMDPNMFPVMTLALHGDLDQQRLKDIAENTVKNRLERLDGVAAVNVTGGLEREIQVLVDPARLQTFGLSISQVVQALQTENITSSGGQVTDAGKKVLVRVNGEFNNLDQIRQVGLTTPGGAVVRLGDVATVKDTTAEQKQFALFDGKPAIGLSIQKQTNGNTVQISHAVKKALQELQQELPPGVTIEAVNDQSKYIESAINTVYRDMILGGLLAMLIIFLFLRSFRSTIIIGLTIPISVITTFVLLYFNHMTLNMMTLGGLSLGIGRMVDDAIVVFDNIYRHRQGGQDAMTAAAGGAQEVTMAVVASTLTTVGVFLPIAFVEGLAAQIFGPLALTVTCSLLASLAVSLSVTPALASRILKGNLPPEATAARGFWQHLITGYWMTRLSDSYRRFLAWALNHRKLVVAAVLLVFVGSLALAPAVGFEFMPQTDEGSISMTIELPRGTELATTAAMTDRVVHLIQQQPEIQSIYQEIGSGGGQSSFLGGETPEMASINLTLVPLKQRQRSATEVAAAIRRSVAGIAGARITVTPTSSFMGSTGQAPVQVDIHGDDLKVLQDLAEKVQEAVARVPGTVAVDSSITRGRPQVEILVDRDRAALYNLGAAQIAATVSTAVGGQVASRYRVGGDEYNIRVQLPADRRQDLNSLANLMVPSPRGTQVPLKEIATLQMDTTPSTIYRYNQDRVASITANLGNRPLGAVMQDIRREVARINLPPGYSIEYTGQNQMMMETFGQLGLALILAIALVYMIMAAQFESLLHPFVIMFAIPVAITGVILALLATGRTFDVVVFMGIIMLVGIVLSNAIVLVDYINILRRRGTPRREAILIAGGNRLRPILMTALVTILAMLPLAMGIGEGAEMNAGLGTAVIGGLTVSTILTLVLVPVLYTLFEDLGQRLGRFLRLPGYRQKLDASGVGTGTTAG